MAYTSKVKYNNTAVDLFCEANKYNPDFGETKEDFFDRLVQDMVLGVVKNYKLSKKQATLVQETETEMAILK